MWFHLQETNSVANKVSANPVLTCHVTCRQDEVQIEAAAILSRL